MKFLTFIAILVLIWGIGLFAFAERVRGFTPAPEPARADAKGYDSLIVVTSDYHMPRALTEIRAAAPGVRLTPYAVETPSLDNSRWWRAAVTARRMTLEYMKYCLLYTSPSPRDKRQSRMPSSA